MPRIRFFHAVRAAFLVLFLSGILAVFSFYPLLATGQEKNGFSQALKLAGETGRYSYRSDVVQKQHPTERPENVGRRATTQKFALAGEFDRTAEALRMQFWPYGREINQSLEMKVEDGRTYGRANEADPWAEVEGGLDLFAPAGDPMGMLDVAEDVRLAGNDEESLFPAELLPEEYNEAVTRYAFDLNGLRYAHLLRAQMEAELRRRGELPPTMNLGLVGEYVDMEGQGELWVDSRGLPLRQILHVEFPAGPEALEWVEADIVTDFSDWRPYGASLLLSLDWREPGTTAVNLLRLYGVDPTAAADNVLILGLVLLMSAFAALSLYRRRARTIQALYSIVFIAALVSTPLLQSRQLSALDTRIADQRRAADAEQVTAAEAADDRHNPHVDPLRQGDDAPLQKRLPVPRDPKAAAVSPASLNSAALVTSSCNVTATSDCDGDGLLDHIEIYETGTWVDAVDSDNDGISDKMEIQAFNAGSRTWYLDPRNPDSNGDGQPDGLECPGRTNIKADGSLDSSVTPSACVDTDNDGAPDVYDFDDDADGVPDVVDDSRLDQIVVNNQAFDLALNDLTPDKSVLVEFSIRPVDSSHLWWTNSQMQWPVNDRNGQIMNVLGQNLPDLDSNMMLSALLEISMPYSSANPSRGLPVKSGVTASDIGKEAPIADWLDSDALQPYNITISQDTTTGVLSAYIPLSLTTDVVGDTPVAWNGRMYYKLPAGITEWGTNHTVKMVWAVNMMNDQCELPQGSTQSWNEYCAGTTNWQTRQSIVQLYYDDFIITGLDLEEDHQVDGLAVAQKQGAAGGSTYYQNYLWHLADTLDEVFLGAQTISGNRFKVTDVAGRLSNWNIPAEALNVDEFYGLTDMTAFYEAMLGNNMISHLGAVFPSAIQGDTEVLLFVAERTLRTAGLTDGASFAANTVTFDLADKNPVTVGFLRWSPYEYNGASWQSPAVSSSYTAGLGTALKSVFTEQAIQALAGSDTDYDFNEAQKGAVMLAQSYFLGIEGGAITLLNDGSEDLSSGALNDADHLLSTEPAVSIVDSMLAEIRAFYSRLSLSNLNLTATDAEIEMVAHATWASLARSPGQLMESMGHASSGPTASGGGEAILQLGGYTNLIDFKSPSIANSYHLLYLSLVGDARSRLGTTGALTSGLYELGHASFKLKSAISNFTKFFSTGADRSVGQFKGLITDSYETWVWIGFAINVTKDVGLFIYDWASGEIRPDTPAFNQKLALTIANIIVQTIITVLFLTISSTLLVAVLAVIFLFDAVVGFICDAVGVKPGSTVDKWVCGGIIQDLAQVIALIINDSTPLVNLSHSGRLEAGLNPPEIVQLTNTSGIVAGNQIAMTGVFTSSLYFNHPHWMGYLYVDEQLKDPNLEETTLKYALQSSKQDINQALNGTSWTSVGGSDLYYGIPTGERFRHTFTSNTAHFDLQAPGINQSLQTYLAEGFGMNEQDCWLVLTEPICVLDTYKDTNHSELTDSIIFDIFPATLAEFRALAAIDGAGYRLAWDDTFPALTDADGDGVLLGTDPDDSQPDYDGDGLSDFFENQHSFPIDHNDIDADGLTDYWEAFYGTDPRQPDTDGDGLLDSEEGFHPNWIYPYENSPLSNSNPPANAPSSDSYAGGWAFVYDYAGATPLHMLVTANPLDADTDDDAIGDLREKEYGYNPRVASALKILGLETAVRSTSNDGFFGFAAPYATADGQLTYTGTINNELDSRYALGLLQVELPEDTVHATQEMGALQPLETASMSGSLPVSLAGLNASGTTSMTIRSGAIISEGTDRILWLHANETAGATAFVDSSFRRNDGHCNAVCPVSNGDYWELETEGTGVLVPTNSDFDFTESGGAFSVGFSLKPGAQGTFAYLLLLKNFTLSYLTTDPGVSGNVMVTIDGGENLTATIPELSWSTILVTYEPTGPSTSTIKIYNNGVLSASWENISKKVSGGSAPNISTGFLQSGSLSLDEYQIFPRVLTSAEAQQLFGRPDLQIDFATNEDIVGGGDVSCTGSSCPTGGSDGATFNQKQHLALSGSSALDFSGEAFSFSTWIKPEARTFPFDTAAVETWNDLYTLDGHGAQPPRDINKDWQGVFGYGGFTSIPAPGGGFEGAVAFAPTLYVNEQGQMRMFMGVNGNDTHTCHYDTAAGLISYDTWQHVTIVYDGSLFYFYVNGELVDTSNTDCADVELPLGTLDIGRSTAWPLLYYDNVNFESFCGTRMHVGINFDGDVSQANIWDKDNTSVDAPLNNKIDLLYQIDQIPNDAEHSFRLYRNPPSYDSNDPSYVHKTGLSNITLGKFSDSFSEICNPDGTESDFGKLYWSMSNDFFQGSLNDFQIYQRPLSPAEVRDFFDSSFGMDFRLDEPPGAVVFSETHDSGTQGICSGSSCPDSGIGGVLNQAARFDGDDYLRILGSDFLNKLDVNFQISAWIKPDKVSGQQMIVAAEQTESVDGFGFGLNGDKLYFTFFGQEEFPSTAATIEPGVWQHVTVAYATDDDPLNTGVLFWVNGVYQDGVYTDNPSARNADDDYRIGSTTAANGSAIAAPFHGLIDEVVVLNRAKFDAEGVDIVELRDRAPVINLHLDEDFRYASFANDGQNSTPATGTAGAGDKGQIREAATFNGSQVLTIPDNSDFDLQTFTIAAWVKPHHIVNSWQSILIKQQSGWADRSYGLHMQAGTLMPALSFRLGASCDQAWILSASKLAMLENQWNHVAATWDGQEAAIYVNGSLDSTLALGAGTLCQNDGPVSIGAFADGGEGVPAVLDEVAVWSEALGADDVRDMFDYQSRWFDIKETHVIVVDDDNPLVSIDLQGPYIAPGSQIIGVIASDPTSEVGLVNYSVGTPEAPAGLQQATFNNGRWTFTLDVPDDQDEILVGVEAVDMVVNSTQSLTTLIVDKTAPDIAFIGDPFLIQNGQTLQMTATIVDSQSGVAKNSVKFALRDRKGHLITAHIPGALDESADGFQCDGVYCSWQAFLPVTQPYYGAFTMEVTAEDNLSNSITSDPKSFVLDTIGPHADVVLQAGTPITPGLTLNGVASDVEHTWSNRTMHLHFEEASGAGTFLDSSKNEMAGTCDSGSGQCPTVGAGGKYGSAIALDGVDDWLTITHPILSGDASSNDVPVVEQLGLYDSSFTVMAWVNGTDWSGNRMVLFAPPQFESPNPPFPPSPKPYTGLFLGVQAGQPIMHFMESGTLSANELPAGEWHHLTWRYNARNQEQAIFVDGVLDASGTGHKPFVGTQALLLGVVGTQYFDGSIDELVVYPMPLTEDQIYNIANPVGASVMDVEIRLRHIDEQGIAETDGVWHQAQLTPDVDFTTWQFTIPDDIVPGPYKIDTRATDSLDASAILNGAAEEMDKESLMAALATVERDNVRVAGGIYVGHSPGEPVDKPPPIIFLPVVGRP